VVEIIRHVDRGIVCCDPEWEAAYRRFETPEEEIRKFLKRFGWFSLASLPRSASIAEIFCGRGNGLVALAQLGFENLHGFDLSEELLLQYRGPAQLHLADCRRLPIPDQTFDAVIVQGGLHHLPDLSNDLTNVCREVRRVLKPNGRFYVVEPWMTPFLELVNRIVRFPIVRRWWGKADALAEMNFRERETYDRWLAVPIEILKELESSFETDRKSVAWGKLKWIGRPRP
jgi:SAM-dependent methyltransferase